MNNHSTLRFVNDGSIVKSIVRCAIQVFIWTRIDGISSNRLVMQLNIVHGTNQDIGLHWIESNSTDKNEKQISKANTNVSN